MRLPETDFRMTENTPEGAPEKLSRYSCKYYAEICCCDFDANAYLADLAKEIRDRLAKEGCDIRHLKLLTCKEGGACSEAVLADAKEEVTFVRAMKNRCTDLPAVLEMTAAADPVFLEKTADEAILDVSGRYNLTVVVFHKECFRLSDERESK